MKDEAVVSKSAGRKLLRALELAGSMTYEPTKCLQIIRNIQREVLEHADQSGVNLRITHEEYAQTIMIPRSIITGAR